MTQNRTALFVGGAALLILTALLIGLGYYLGSQNAPSDTAGPSVAAQSTSTATLVSATATSPPTPSPPATDEPDVDQEPVETDDVVEEAKPEEPTSTPAPPEISSIVFTEEIDAAGDPVEPVTSFDEGISRVHVVFEHDHMQPDYTWARVWYHDGQEMLKSTDQWSGEASGRFDYFLDTEGAPLPPGAWLLELYVENELLASAEFTIEPQQIAAAPTTEPTTQPSVQPTTQPTIEPTAEPPVVRATNPPARVYQLAYSDWDGGTHYVYLADTNGQNRRFLISRAAGPSWSADGQQLFFYGMAGVNQQLREGRVECEFGTISDGIVAVDLSFTGDICRGRPGAWFCERKQIDVQSPPSDVCEQNGVRIFQNLDWKEGTARWASVAPDGQAVAFDARPGGNYRIYFRSIFDNQQFRFELSGEQGDWSPDGRRLVYRSGRDNRAGIWISNRDDSGHSLVFADGTASFPAWSPDGQTIAFSRTEYGNLDIYTVDPDGSNLQRLTDDPGHDTLAAYTPGGQIIFRSDRSGSWGIWKMNGDGSNQTEIIPNVGLSDDWAFSKMDVR